MIELNGEPAQVRQVAALALTNYGHFTTLRVADGRVRGLELHLARLVRDCRLVFGAELDPEQVRTRLRAAVADASAPVTARVTVFDPGLALERPGARADPQLLVTTRPAAATTTLPPLRVRSVEYRRELPQVKHTGLFGLLHQRRLAQLAGFDDALLTGPGGVVCEGATWNILFHDGRHLVAPEADQLPGITAALLARAHGGPQRTEPVTVGGLGRFEAAFATNAGFGVRPIAQIDGVGFDPDHPVLARLREEYQALPAERL
ncbi:aminotransferase class IV family protein [Kitasatospora sp. NPDC049258]|uniref:aminotransferase class IV family protein n=1 Tax=Kitasatospora sp. NPDC049258 TaxID=3155394 RepID=UPI00343E8E3E